MNRTLTLSAVLLMATALPAVALGQSPSAPASIPNPLTVVRTLDQATTGLVKPHAMAVGPDDNLYIADFEPSIRVISPSGQPIRSWGTKGSGPGELNFSSRASIAVDAAGQVYVLEGANHRVQVFQPDGTYVRQFGGFGGQPGQFVDPMVVMVDRQSNAYVVDDAQQKLTKFDPTGAVQWTIDASSGPDPDLVGHIHRGAFDSQDHLWLTNDGNSRVVAIDADGHKVDAFGAHGTGPGQFEGTFSIAFDASGNAYVDECSDKRLQVLDPQHEVIGVFKAPGGLPFGDNYAFGRDGLLYAIAGGDHCAGTAPSGSAAADILVMQVALPEAANASLEGTWQTAPLTKDDLRRALESAALPADGIETFLANQGWSDHVVWSIGLDGGKWVLYGSADDAVKDIQAHGNYEVVDGDTVIYTDDCGAITFDYAVAGDKLTLHATDDTCAPGTDEAYYAAAIYNTAPFARVP